MEVILLKRQTNASIELRGSSNKNLIDFIGSNLTFINQNTKALIWPIPGAGLLCNRVWRGLRTSNTPPMSSHHSAKVRILAEKSFLLFLIFTVNLATKKLLTICHVILIPYSNWVGSSNGQIQVTKGFWVMKKVQACMVGQKTPRIHSCLLLSI